MKKALLALLAGSLAIPAVAQEAGGIVLGPDEGFEEAYKNRGQCEAALAQGRNDRRKAPETRGEPYTDLSGGEYNKASRTTTRCEELDDGAWSVVFYPNGY